jgi:hypothetical protein
MLDLIPPDRRHPARLSRITFEDVLYRHYQPGIAAVDRLVEENDLFLRDQQRIQYDQMHYRKRLHEFVTFAFTDH